MPHDTILRLSQYGIAQRVELDKIINTPFALTNESIIYPCYAQDKIYDDAMSVS